MKINTSILFVFLFFWNIGLSQVDSSFRKSLSGKTNFVISYHHSGSYNKERSFVFLDQSFEYRLHRKVSLGIGFGFNLFPAAIGTPIFCNGRYYFRIKKIEFNIEQSYGKYLKLNNYGFSSNRNFGAINAEFRINKKMTLSGQSGYIMLWDKNGGRDLSLLIGLGLTYPIWKRK